MLNQELVAIYIISSWLRRYKAKLESLKNTMTVMTLDSNGLNTSRKENNKSLEVSAMQALQQISNSH